MDSVQTDQDENIVKVKLNLDFYSVEDVLAATKDFFDLGQINMAVDDKNNNVIITISPKDKADRLETIGYEFCNYVLGMTKNR
ncbi:hypothetical protein GQ472_04030 [archaeon]|nr:hypothetical protein [archaeon]